MLLDASTRRSESDGGGLDLAGWDLDLGTLRKGEGIGVELVDLCGEWNAAEDCREEVDSLESGLENQECLRGASKVAGGRRIAGPAVVARRLEEDYRIESKVLGTGISGQVHLATCRRTGRKVAVKSIRRLGAPGQERSAAQWDDALNEARIYTSVAHPNIAELLQVYDEPDAMHIVMECLEGGEAFHRLVARKRYSEAEAADVARQVLGAATYLHSQKVVHCDFKLENLLYSHKDSRSVKLIDFGFSRRLSGGDSLTQPRGTLQSMAPEVLRGAYCEKADVWSIGVLLYMLLTGRHLYTGSKNEVRAKVFAGRPDFATSFERLSAGAQSLVRSLLTVDPHQRPSAKVALTHPWLCEQGARVEAQPPADRSPSRSLRGAACETRETRMERSQVAPPAVQRRSRLLWSAVRLTRAVQAACNATGLGLGTGFT